MGIRKSANWETHYRSASTDRQLVAKSGVPFSPHDLRRTFASIVSRLGDRLSYYTTKRLLNHRTSDVTRGYIQFDIEQLRCAMQAVEDFVLTHLTRNENAPHSETNDSQYQR